ncbi:MAG: hypothetical protein EOM20_09175 [Spartobacteria bacterium]|nr:hypothetical protein [Spartobacteria bacterium]
MDHQARSCVLCGLLGRHQRSGRVDHAGDKYHGGGRAGVYSKRYQPAGPGQPLLSCRRGPSVMYEHLLKRRRTMKMQRVFRVMVVVSVLSAFTARSDVQLTIDAAPEHQRPISKRIYGVNIANWAADHYALMCAPRLREAKASVIRYGATNIERYNWRNNRLYNVISLENQYVPMSWRTFVEWCHEDMDAEPFIQVPAFGRVASDDGDSNYNSNQPIHEIAAWVEECGTNVNIWGIGNEPFIAWKLVQYEAEGYAYNDGAHGDQIFLEDLNPEVFYDRWVEIGAAIRGANSQAVILGPTPANWYLYWGTDFSAFCPVTRARAEVDWPDHLRPWGYTNDAGWFVMSSGLNQFDGRVFPGRDGLPDVIGWEMNPETGTFNDKRNMNMFVQKVAEYADANGGTQVCNYLDFHRYMNTDNEAAAVQELRDLWEPGFSSSDKETGNAHDARIIDRFQNIIEHYNPGQDMGLSLSEYDYFYWQGHPADPYVAGLGQIDYLGIFAKYGVKLACNWYIGEPDQSGGGYHHAADSAKQAMFDEHGDPNPKYWAFKLMSLHFRDQALTSVVSHDNSLFSVYGGVDTNANELTIVSHYKGLYHPWYDPDHPGAFMENQGTTNAMLVISNFNITGVKQVLRYGHHDPEIMTMEPGGVHVQAVGDHQQFVYEYEPLSIYLMTFYGNPSPPAEEAPATHLHVAPAHMEFGAYETGIEILEEEDHTTHEVTITTNFKYCIEISNTRNSQTTWSVSESSPWLDFLTSTSGVTKVTDQVFLEVDRTGLPVGIYSTKVTVATSEGTVLVPVTMEVTPRAAGGEVRICDFDSGSLAHTWVIEEPYAIGFYDQHGQPADMERPYVYNMFLDYEDVSQFGGIASMRVDFDRSNGDTAAGDLYLAFGTYGHQQNGVTTSPVSVWCPAGEPLSNYVLKVDVKTKTEGPGFTRTEFTMVVSDNDGNVGKPGIGLSNFKDRWILDDGYWQTISIPLDSVFYDWSYPGGQDGAAVAMNFSAIKQMEFMPWVGRDDKKGSVWIDNIRIETLNGGSNRFPVAVAEQSARLVGTNVVVQLCATNSYDPDGTIAVYEWRPATGLSDPASPMPVFSAEESGTYYYELTVTDNNGLKSRNPAQVIVNVQETLFPESIRLYRDAAHTDEITGTASNCMDLYVAMQCLSGGNPDTPDFTMATLYSSDAYGPDAGNNTDPIDVVLEETGADTRLFTGRFRLAAFSDQDNAEIGVSEGSLLTISNNGYSVSTQIGKQWYGRQDMIDHIEAAADQFNAFGGVWNTYDDAPNGNGSTVLMMTTNDAAPTGSSRSMYCDATLHLLDPQKVDQLFAGFMTKLTPYTNDVPEAVCDLSSTSGYKGVSFWMKGNGTRVSVVLKSFAITNYDDYLYTIEATPSAGWKQFVIPFDRFAQEGWGNEAIDRDTALRHVNALQFKFASKTDAEYNQLFIDDLALFGGNKYYLPHGVYHKQNRLSMEGGDGGLVSNPGFDQALGGWVTEGNATYENWSGWRMVFENWTGTNYGRVWQRVPVDDTKAYNFSMNAWKNAGYNGEAAMELFWYDADTNLVGMDSLDITASLTAGAQPFSLDWRWAAEDAAFVEVAIVSSAAIVPPYTDNGMQVDDAILAEYGLNADDGWISGWIPGSTHSYSTNAVEGLGALRVASTNAGWLSGMFVAPYDTGQTRTNFSHLDGFALKARMPENYSTNGDCMPRIRLAVATNEDPVARTRWYPVGAASWGDYILFPKEKFLTAASVDENDPVDWDVWDGDWSNISRIIIEYGPSVENVQPYDLLLDDFRPYADAYVVDDIVDPPITNTSGLGDPFVIYNDVGTADGTAIEMTGTAVYDPDFADPNAPEGSTCLRIEGVTAKPCSMVYTQNAHIVFTTNTEGYAVNLDIAGDYLYLADGAGGVNIYDISSPAVPVRIANIPYGSYARDVKVEGNRLYVAGNPFRVYDVSNPAAPVLLGSASVGNASAVDVDGNYAYLVRRDSLGALCIVDVSNPANPVQVGMANMGSVDCHVEVAGNMAYVALQDTGFHAIDVASKTAPVVLSTNRVTYAMGLALNGNYAYVGTYRGLFVMDISNPGAPVEVKSLLQGNYIMRDLYLDGNKLYVTTRNDIYILDVTNPGHPEMIGHITRLPVETYGVHVKGNYAYIANHSTGLCVADVSAPGGSADLQGYANGYLKFSVKTAADADIGFNASGTSFTRALSACHWNGNNEWQEISISLREWGVRGSQLNCVFMPFSITPKAGGAILIDNVRVDNRP